MDVEKPANCTCFNLRKAARTVTQLYDEALRPTGLRATQVTLLIAVGQAGPITMKDLARFLAMDRTTLTRNLKPLLEQDLVTIAEAEDRRHRPIALTARGQDVLAEALPYWREVQTRIAKELGQDRWARLIGDLERTTQLLQTE